MSQHESIKRDMTTTQTETRRLYGKARDQIRAIRRVRANGLGPSYERAYVDLFFWFRDCARTERRFDAKYGPRPAAF